MYRIVQITDLHVGADGERPDNVDVRGNFKAVVAAARNERPDRLVVSGDLSLRDGDRDAYRFIRQQLDGLDSDASADARRLPYHVIAGNHDISTNLAQEFGVEADLHGEELYYALDVATNQGGTERFRLIFLDSARATMSDRQLAWLRGEIFAAGQAPAIVFVHHPPMPCDCRFMDANYPFRRSTDLVPLLESLPGLKGVYCGHYHAEVEAPLPGRPDVLVHITPSLWFQIDRTSSDLVISSLKPAYRVITIEGHTVSSRVRYVSVEKE